MRKADPLISFTQLGDGFVATHPPADALVKPDRVVEAPRSPRAVNCRLYEGLVRPRNGYTDFTTTASANPVTGLFLAKFDADITYLFRAEQSSIKYAGYARDWIDITFSPSDPTNPGSENSCAWVFAMVRRAGMVEDGIATQLFFANGWDADPLWYWVANTTTATAVPNVPFTGPRVLVPHRGRVLCANVFEDGRKGNRVWWSIFGDPTNFLDAGSGYTELDDDTFPVVNGTVIGGNVCLFKGDPGGGSIVVGTPTGSSIFPYRFDTVNTQNIGLYLPRTLVAITAQLSFFVGHNGFYLYDGARGLLSVGDSVARSLVSRVNKDKRYNAFAWYVPSLHVVRIALPLDASTYPNEVWEFNTQDRRVYGPLTYAHSFTAQAMYSHPGTLTWDDYNVGETWDTLVGATEIGGGYVSFDNDRDSAISDISLYGTSTGEVFYDDNSLTTDDGTAITQQYTSAAITGAHMVYFGPRGERTTYDHNDAFTLRSFSIIYNNQGSWTPTVEISTDGGNTWTTVSDGTAIGGATAIGRATEKVYHPEIYGSWFQARISGTGMYLTGIRFEFTYAGDTRSAG